MFGMVARRFFRGLFYGVLSFVFVYVANYLQSQILIPTELSAGLFAILMAADKAVREMAKRS